MSGESEALGDLDVHAHCAKKRLGIFSGLDIASFGECVIYFSSESFAQINEVITYSQMSSQLVSQFSQPGRSRSACK